MVSTTLEGAPKLIQENSTVPESLLGSLLLAADGVEEPALSSRWPSRSARRGAATLPRFNQDHHALLGRPSPCGGALASFPPHRPSAARRPSSCPARAASAARRTTVVIASATRLNSWHDRAHFLAPRAPARRPPCRGRRRLGRARRRRPAGPLRGVPARRRQRRRTRARARGRRGWSAGGAARPARERG